MSFRLILALLLFTSLSACKKDEFFKTCPGGKTLIGRDCKCSESAGGRVMGRNGEICVHWEGGEYNQFQQIAFSRGEVGMWFAIFEEPLADFFSDTLFFAPISYAEPDEANPGDSIYQWSGFFGELGGFNKGVETGIAECDTRISQDAWKPRRHSAYVPRLSSLSHPRFRQGDYWVCTFGLVDWDKDCEYETAVAKGYMDSENSGTGELVWFNESPNGGFDAMDTIPFRLTPVPRDW